MIKMHSLQISLAQGVQIY